MRSVITVIFTCCASAVSAQVVNTATMDTTDYQIEGKLTVEGYLDGYYAYNFNKPGNKEQPYLVSMARHNEMNINLAFVDLKYAASRVRARIAPGSGTYMNANYTNEQGTLKHFVEANAGFKLSTNKNIWIDAGILGSPYTNESAISKDHLTYTRSVAAENVPYYLAGVKLTVPVSAHVNAYLYLVNGWQQINDLNSNKSIGTQIEWRPSSHLLINWNTYTGNEQSAADSVEGLRTFTDLYLIYNKNRWSVTSCIYLGRQQANELDRTWWQANVIGRYTVNSQVSVSARLEYFQDDDGVVLIPISDDRFRTFGTSAGIDLAPDPNLLFRTELRYFFSQDDIFLRKNMAANNSMCITLGACIWLTNKKARGRYEAGGL